jgi:hypothetical protein
MRNDTKLALAASLNGVPLYGLTRESVRANLRAWFDQCPQESHSFYCGEVLQDFDGCAFVMTIVEEVTTVSADQWREKLSTWYQTRED